MHSQILEKASRPIDHIPTRPIHIEMRLHCQCAIVNEGHGGIKFKLD